MGSSTWKAALSLDRPRLWAPVALIQVLVVPAALEVVETVGWSFAGAFILWVATCLTSRVPPPVRGGHGGYRAVLGGWVLPTAFTRTLPAADEGPRRLRGAGPFSGLAAQDDGITRPGESASADPESADPAMTMRRAARSWLVRRVGFAAAPAAATVILFGAFVIGPWLLLGWLAALVTLELAFYAWRWRRFAVVELDGGKLRVSPVFVNIDSITAELHPREVQVRERRRSLFDSIGVIQLDDLPQLEVTVRGRRFVAVGDVVAPLLEWAQRDAPAPYR